MKFTVEADEVTRDDMPITVSDGGGAGAVMGLDPGAHAARKRSCSSSR